MTAAWRVAWPESPPRDWRDYDTEQRAEFEAGELVKQKRTAIAVVYRVDLIEGEQG